jgi:hypothetical protein
MSVAHLIENGSQYPYSPTSPRAVLPITSFALTGEPRDATSLSCSHFRADSSAPPEAPAETRLALRAGRRLLGLRRERGRPREWAVRDRHHPVPGGWADLAARRRRRPGAAWRLRHRACCGDRRRGGAVRARRSQRVCDRQLRLGERHALCAQRRWCARATRSAELAALRYWLGLQAAGARPFRVRYQGLLDR